MIDATDAFHEERNAMIGADQVAMSVAYLILFYHRLWPIAGGIALFDVAYYGLLGASAPSVAGLAFLTLL